MIFPAFSLFILRRLPFERFTFSRWSSVAAITWIGLLVALDPAMHSTLPEAPTISKWLTIALAVLSVWAAFLIIVAILRWWMKRGGRWDGQGDLFNLVAASWLVADTLGAGLSALGVPSMGTLPIWLYSVWVGANALSGAIPKASLRYSIAGIVIGLIPAMVVSGVVFASAGMLMSMTDMPPLPPGTGPEGIE